MVLKKVHRALPNVPLIGMGGIMSATDAIEFLLAGATAVAVGTATFVNPTASTDIVTGLENYLVASIKGLRKGEVIALDMPPSGSAATNKG